MALDGTYDGLKASVADFLNRSDAATIAAIPDFIAVAEAQMARRFVSRMKDGLPAPRRLIGRSDASFALADEYVSVPDDIMGPLELSLTGADNSLIDMDYLENSRFQREKQLARWIGAPKYYTVVGGQIQIFPVADQAYAAELTYIARVAALSSTNQANWILVDYPDAYLYGALTASAPYLKDDARTSTWGALFNSAMDDICNSDPMPTDKTLLRTEIAEIQRYSRGGGVAYSINTDS